MDVYAGRGREATSPVPLGAFVVGNQSGSSLTGVGGHQLGVQVELTRPGALALFGDVGSCTTPSLPLDEVARRPRRPGWSTAWPRRPSWAERLASPRRVRRLALRRPATDAPALSPEVAWLRRQLEASQGRARVEPLMDETGLEPAPRDRALSAPARRVAQGLRPAAALRARRARCSTGSRPPGRTLADVAIAAGYYDQSHLTRDFVALAGMTPGAYVADAVLAPEVRFVQDRAGRARTVGAWTMTNDTDREHHDRPGPP